MYVQGSVPADAAGALRRSRGFSLVELLTVMFIIGLLVGLVIPSLNSARNSAKKTATAQTLQAIKTGLELFRNENEKDFLRTNGYPPSFAHPPIPESPFDAKASEEGRFPFLVQTMPRVLGAHWLPAMLMGVDRQGYVPRSAVPKRNNLHKEPWKWYLPDPLSEGKALDRRTLYLDPNTRTIATERLIGKPNMALFPDWANMKVLPVIVDSFDQPILYYAANAQGKPTNMVAEKRDPTNSYTGGTQEVGPPYYFHQDNHGFTGDEMERGWDFGSGADPTTGQVHELQYAGHDQTAVDLSERIDLAVRPGDPGYIQPTFARFILDRRLREELEEKKINGQTIDPATPLRPVNEKSFLLISAGVDGKYGTRDDVTNFPLSTE